MSEDLCPFKVKPRITGISLLIIYFNYYAILYKCEMYSYHHYIKLSYMTSNQGKPIKKRA
jgi:hypothetical protein